MTDIPQFNVTAEQFASLTPAGQQTLESALSKAGASPEYLASLKGTAANKSGAPSKPATEQLIQPFTVAGKPASDPKFSPPATAAGNEPYDKKVQAFQKLRGVVADSQLQDAAKAEGVNWSDVTKEASAAPPQNLLLQEANERLAASSGPFAASQSPSDFSFQFESRHIDGLQPDEVANIRDMFANAWHAATIPVTLGQGLFAEAMRAANTYTDMPDEQAKLRYAEEGQRLRRLGNVEQIVADHNYAWERLPADFKEAAMEHRMFHLAESFKALADAGALMRLRDSRKAK